MASEAKAARVGESMTVADHQTRPGPEMVVGAEEGGNLPEAQKTRDVGECGAPLGATDLKDLKPGPTEDNERSMEQAGVRVIGYVRPGHPSDGSPKGGQGNTPREPDLQTRRLFWGEAPGMGRDNPHQGSLSAGGSYPKRPESVKDGGPSGR